MVQRGEVSLADPVAKYLPSGIKMPERGGKVITLEEPGQAPVRIAPSADKPECGRKSLESVCAILRTAALRVSFRLYAIRDIGAAFEYSNLGVGCLDTFCRSRPERTMGRSSGRGSAAARDE